MVSLLNPVSPKKLKADEKRILQNLNWLYDKITKIDASNKVNQMNTVLHNWVPTLYRLSLSC